MTAAAVHLSGFGFRFAGADRSAVENVDLDLPPGSVLLVLGPSGSGKSTLALGLAGLLGRDVPGTVTGTMEIGSGDRGLVFQDADRQVVMERVEDDVAFGLESRAWPLQAMRTRVPEALADVGLADRPRAVAATLSGGQRQRLALAGALAPDPALLVLDEPTANLDPDARTAFLERLAALKARGSTTMVIVEHRVDDVWPLADRLLALGRDGRPLAEGPPATVAERDGARMIEEGIWLPRWLEPPLPAAAAGRAGREVPAAPLVDVHDLGYAYPGGPPVLRDLELAVGTGERVAIVGANGSGKSTLARLLVGLVRPDRGQVNVAGQAPYGRPPAERASLAGLVFQDPELGFLAPTVDDDVRLGLPQGPATAARVSELMEALRLPLSSYGRRSPYRLSGGEQRRLSLAPALLREPDLLVLDEPTFAQDRHGVVTLLGLLGAPANEHMAMVVVSHDERFVAAFATRVMELRDGRLHDRAP
ncbi:MAG: ABC transporter ATP-binding protein [Candidatus Limnocylindrales bacterium]